MNFLLVLIGEGPGGDDHFNLGSLRTTDTYLRVIKDFFLPFLFQGLLPHQGK